ncbi:serine/threonine protein kinase [Gimesia fumaroli]|uniref:non-specific serine/threonine protein kinase n=1 Tax=Gimesia fumaroli TaxID=2527976 RepID=A0A518IFW7_9PLAN|nr:serine/threonine-protein kinase [Gimesia fumaroli]QDV51981.1 Serine/threonine-protein kinase PrkC [Gimesia fumaroli]
MPSDKRRKKIRPVSAGATGESSPPPSSQGKGVRTQQAPGIEDSDSTQETIYQTSETPRTSEKGPSTNLIGRQLDDFKILRKLGQGGMATVYLAEQVSLKREAAIKVMHNELMSDETHVRRFEREAKAAAGLTHPNIVQVYMTGDFEGTHYIAQEYVRGINLREHLARNAPPDCTLILRIMRQVTAALNAAAEKGIVHRDIKPENIMITSRKLIKVADFGLAQIAQSDERVELTQVGTTMGTPLYMSPEQVNGKPLDQRSDIYSLGVTCYHLISGRPPFHGETALSIAVKHLNEPPPSLSKRRPDLPVELCDLIHRMMEKDPDKRPANAAELMQAIKKIPEQPSLKQGRNWTSLIPFQSNRGFQKQLLAFILASLCLGGVAAAIGWVNRPGDPLNAPFQEQAGGEAVESIIPHEKTAIAQFFLAMRLKDKEEAWKAVINYEPVSAVYKNIAQIRLGILLIKPDRYDEAKAIFQELANSGQPKYEVNGYAGLMALESINGNARGAQDIWDIRVRDHVNDLDAGLIEYVVTALEENQIALKADEVDNSEFIRDLSNFDDEEVRSPGP